MAGLVVRARHVDVDTLIEVQALLADGLPFNPDHDEALTDVCERLAASVVEWNLEAGDGTPEPCTVAVLRRQDPLFLQSLVGAWTAGLTRRPPPEASPATAETAALEVLADLPTTVAS